MAPKKTPPPEGLVITIDPARTSDHVAAVASWLSWETVETPDHDRPGRILTNTYPRLRVGRLLSSQLWGADDSWRESLTITSDRLIEWMRPLPLDRLLWLVMDSSGSGDHLMGTVARRAHQELRIDVRRQVLAGVATGTGTPGGLVGGGKGPTATASVTYAVQDGQQMTLRWRRILTPRTETLEAAWHLANTEAEGGGSRLALPRDKPDQADAIAILDEELRQLPAPDRRGSGRVVIGAPPAGKHDDMAFALGMAGLIAQAAPDLVLRRGGIRWYTPALPRRTGDPKRDLDAMLRARAFTIARYQNPGR